MKVVDSNTYIIDSSYVLAYLLPDEQVTHVDETFAKYTRGEIFFISPTLLPFEIINGLRYAVISKRISIERANILITAFSELDIFFKEISLPGVFSVSFEKKQSVYDASYLWLAQTMNLPLLTLDKKLKFHD